MAELEISLCSVRPECELRKSSLASLRTIKTGYTDDVKQGKCMVIQLVLKVGVPLGITVILGIIMYIIWSIPDLPNYGINEELCLPKWPGSPKLQCDNVDVTLSGFMNKRLNSLHEEYLAAETRRVEAEIKELSMTIKNFLETVYPYRRPAARFVGKYAGEIIDGVGVVRYNAAIIGQMDGALFTDDSPAMTPILNWQSGRQNTNYGGFKRFGVQIEDGRIVVPLTGLYTVYSLIDMYEPCDSTTGMPNIKVLDDNVRHSIHRYNVKTGVDEEIVSSSIPHQKSKRFRYNYYSSYVSTVYKLTAGDELTLMMSNATYLNFSPEKNYFGVSMI